MPWLSLAASLFGFALSAGVFGPQTGYALAPAWLAEGELHRLYTGHFVHYNASHLWGDLLAFAAWAAFVERTSRRLFVLTLVFGAPLLSLAILLAAPELREYRGLSGLDCALVAELVLVRGFGVGAPFERAPSGALRNLAVVCAAAFAAKCAYELVSGHAIVAQDLGPGVVLVVAAHPLGALTGVLAVAISRAFSGVFPQIWTNTSQIP